MCEELAELQVAVLHYRDNKNTIGDVIEEIADVQIQIHKIAVWLGEFNYVGIDEVYDKIESVEYEKSYQLEKIIDKLIV